MSKFSALAGNARYAACTDEVNVGNNGNVSQFFVLHIKNLTLGYKISLTLIV